MSVRGKENLMYNMKKDWVQVFAKDIVSLFILVVEGFGIVRGCDYIKPIIFNKYFLI